MAQRKLRSIIGEDRKWLLVDMAMNGADYTRIKNSQRTLIDSIIRMQEEDGKNTCIWVNKAKQLSFDSHPKLKQVLKFSAQVCMVPLPNPCKAKIANMISSYFLFSYSRWIIPCYVCNQHFGCTYCAPSQKSICSIFRQTVANNAYWHTVCMYKTEMIQLTDTTDLCIICPYI